MEGKKLLSPVVAYTRFVLLGRGFLWTSIAGLIVLMIVLANNEAEDTSNRLVFSNVKVNENLQNEMLNPHYQGLDKDNLPYSVIADKAIQLDSDTVRLENIKADMATKDSKWLALHAGSGIMKIENRFLTLNDKVDMFYDGGYEFRTISADVDIKAGRASGNQPVEGQGPLGTLNANSFEVTEQGKVIRFNGSVRVILYRK